MPIPVQLTKDCGPITPPPILGITEIAERYGVKPQAVNKWSQSKNFPEPAYRLRAGRFWLRDDIARWIEEFKPEIQGPSVPPGGPMSPM